MANTFTRDLFELDHLQFLEKYERGNLSLGEFHELRARASFGPKNQILFSGVLSVDTGTTVAEVLSLTGYIITGIFVRVYGSAVTVNLNLDNSTPAGLLWYLVIPATGNSTEFSLSNFELIMGSSGLNVSLVSGTEAVVQVTLLGYLAAAK